MKTNEPIYVAYLPVPRALRVWIFVTTFFAIALVLVLATCLASWQSDPGDGVWNTDEIVTLQGVLTRDAYPLLIALDPQKPGKTFTVIPIREGKHGAAELLAPWRGLAIRISGYALRRGSLRMLELQDDSQPITAASNTDESLNSIALQLTTATSKNSSFTGSPTTLEGEIIDPKCWSGSMKPGEGKTHKACATLCIRGGIPPVFLLKNPFAPAKIYLMATHTGQSPDNDEIEKILPFVGDQVRGRGLTQTRDGIDFIWLDPTTLVRQ